MSRGITYLQPTLTKTLRKSKKKQKILKLFMPYTTKSNFEKMMNRRSEKN